MSPIRRYKNNVGKSIGGNIYVHKQYATEIVPQDFLRFREPWAGGCILVGPLGFDVQKSYKWSKKWLSRLKEPASVTRWIWKEQLANVGLS